MAGMGWEAFVVLCACVGIGCGSSPSSVSAPQEAKVPESPVSRFLPLVDGNQWAFDAEDDESSGKGMFVTRVRRLPGPRFSLMSSQGSHVLEVRADGIVREESKAYVLRAPLTAGAQWPGENDATVRVVFDRSHRGGPRGQIRGLRGDNRGGRAQAREESVAARDHHLLPGCRHRALAR